MEELLITLGEANVENLHVISSQLTEYQCFSYYISIQVA